MVVYDVSSIVSKNRNFSDGKLLPYIIIMHKHLAWSVLIFDDHDDEHNFGNVPLSHDDLMIITNHDENVDQHDENADQHDENADQYDENVDQHDGNADQHDENDDKHYENVDQHDENDDQHD